MVYSKNFTDNSFIKLSHSINSAHTWSVIRMDGEDAAAAVLTPLNGGRIGGQTRDSTAQNR